MSTQPVETILIGAGQRGADTYGAYILTHPEEIRLVAVAEPDAQRRAKVAQQHHIPVQNQFESWEPLLDRPALGAAALICTQDQMHTAPTLAALRQGYHVLLEKPMAATLQECKQMVQEAEDSQKQLHICHVLRYTSHFSRMREILLSGVLGQVVNISQRENLSWWHMAHSYVRGNWRNTAQSSPMILAKCCHDLDILVWLLDSTCETLSSVGSLLHFRPEHAPAGAPAYCLDGCPASESCPYYAPFIYIDKLPLWRSVADSSKGLERWATTLQLKNPSLLKWLSRGIPLLRQVSDYRGWPVSVVSPAGDAESVLAALRNGPYGRCVFHCDNDVVDHQVVSMQFASGASATLTMHGHSNLEGRTTRIEGICGELLSAFSLGDSWIEVRQHRSGQRVRVDTSTPVTSGHGGGDAALMSAFVRAVRLGEHAAVRTSARQSLESHLMAFAAEESRLNHQSVNLQAYRQD
ncbi:MAG: Gfo/Idh/MocA family oxidoreductase [Anaerolineales bacterium]|jgi:predicted dehydrogenase|nr:Gfo/Idh/MocA family oxidoreductase [Anaerolineales bacterium]